MYYEMIRTARLCGDSFVVADEHHHTERDEREDDDVKKSRSLDYPITTFSLNWFKKMAQ